MKITDENIDKGKAFDWGLTSKEYAKYRDIYPEVFYDKIVERNLCVNGQTVLDLGTGTGVLPRNMYKYGAKWIGADISENQIIEAERLSKTENMDIKYIVSGAENIDFPNNRFDVITACQCFWYFNHKVTAPKFAKILKKNGRLLVLYMAWLPLEDNIAGASEELVLKYSPDWSGAKETMHPIEIPREVYDYFELLSHEEYKIKVPFTRDSWHGRMKVCRGVGASLNEQELASWEKEHKKLLSKIAPQSFEVLHYAALAELKIKSNG